MPNECHQFERLVAENPTAGPLELVVGVRGLHGPGESSADISDVLLNRDRVGKELRALIGGPNSKGDSFVQDFADFESECPEFVILSTIGNITVISTQTPFMRSQLLKDEPVDAPVNGLVSDAAHGWWAYRTHLLMVTSVYSPVLFCWVPAVMSFTNGASADHFKFHFLALFQSIAEEAEERDMAVNDDLFAG
ncbi:hypothetical protein H0H87_011372, partial [Tephrocybe sp. NHM501043]